MPMDSEYGITVTNKYSFLVSDDEEDPSELRQKELAEKEEKARRNKEEKAKKAAKDPERKPKSAKLPDKKKPLSTSAKEKENVPDRPKKEDPPSTRPNRAERRRQQQESNTVNVDGDERSDRQPRRDRGNRPKRTQDNEEGGRNVFTEYRTERTDSDRAPRGRGGFGRGGRGRGRGGFFGGRDFRGKREFERHSGSEKSSGVRPSEKRDGGGAYNWGSQTDAADDLNVTAGSAEENPEWTAPTEEGENSEAKEGAEGQEAPGEQEPKEMTLDEWKALQAKDTKPKATGFKLRKAGEGEDLTQWKKTYVLKKGQEEEDADKDFFPLKDGQELRAVSSRGGERGQKQPSVELNFHFADSPQRGRGGRRGGRGRGGDDRPRGAGRGRGGVRYNGADPGAYIDVDNEADFPQLGK